MRSFVFAILALVGTLSAMAEEMRFADAVKASLVFRDDFDPARSHYPHLLKVFLRLDNGHDSDVLWVADPVNGMEAELLDAAGRPVPHPPSAMSIQSAPRAYLLPWGSRLDWLISHGGISMMGDATDQYALIVGARGWLIPIDSAQSYTLRVRLRGVPWRRTVERAGARPNELLLDLPPARLEVAQ
ncbi:MAG TPA: hypothetical protein VNQ90_20760 [Chthoniobacteraceae bacterium]|nr:hypothetical protein [Chthoniobacteraceae bacterium]